MGGTLPAAAGQGDASGAGRRGLVAAVALWAACAAPPTGEHSGEDTAGPVGTEAPLPSACAAAVDLIEDGAALGEGWQWSIETSATDELAGSCAASPGGEAVFRFTPPRGGPWRLSSADSEAPTALSVRADCADAASERACAPTRPPIPHAERVLDLAADETVWVIVERLDGLVPTLATLTAQPLDAPPAPPRVIDGAARCAEDGHVDLWLRAEAVERPIVAAWLGPWRGGGRMPCAERRVVAGALTLDGGAVRYEGALDCGARPRRVRVAVEDAGGHRSAPVDLPCAPAEAAR